MKSIDADREKMKWDTNVKEVINALETSYKYSNVDEDNTLVPQQIVLRVIALLKEQEPIKPTINVDTWICSKCGHVLESQELIDDKENAQILVHEQYQYCPECGREIKWE